MLLAGKVARDTDPLQSAYTQGTLLNRSCGVFILFFFVLISRKQRVGKQRSLRTAGSLSKEWMAEHKVLTHPLMRGHQAVQPALVVWRHKEYKETVLHSFWGLGPPYIDPAGVAMRTRSRPWIRCLCSSSAVLQVISQCLKVALWPC